MTFKEKYIPCLTEKKAGMSLQYGVEFTDNFYKTLQQSHSCIY